VTFYSENDEAAFFEWLSRISCISKLTGEGYELRLQINRTRISDGNLRELIAVFTRYKIDMRQLAQFLTEKNRGWFKDNPDAYWHKKIFGRNISPGGKPRRDT
ncbi:MAG: hypothetical protein LPK88_00115, partial [Alphaproteobacteria bacterium]|nr:hypothetical protein [Alphaproteobacteria bacterium]MDX5414715.1 hypothetical protein [Alphaproteobacteria bacterium]MDX5491895.1 hypothetical protein [Alphaproteobacteria bacterium]